MSADLTPDGLAEQPKPAPPAKVKEHKPTRWVLAKPGPLGSNTIRAFGRTMKITNELLADPKFIALLGKVEVMEKTQLFGTVVVRG